MRKKLNTIAAVSVLGIGIGIGIIVGAELHSKLTKGGDK